MSEIAKAVGGINYLELGAQNDLSVLRVIGAQGWVREYELALLTGFHIEKTELICRRLAKKGQIFRERKGNDGIFMRLRQAGADKINGRSGKDVEIPRSWAHDCLAIQSLNFLKGEYKSKQIQTESMIRTRGGEKGKIPDGALQGVELFFEQEWSRKSGKLLSRQVHKVVELAKKQISSVVSYPYPATICGGIDHEVRHGNAIRDRLGPASAPVKFLRCHFFSVRTFETAKVDRFELIELPDVKKTRSDGQRSGQLDEISRIRRKFQWHDRYSREGGLNILESILFRGDQTVEKVKFIESSEWESPHILVWGEERIESDNDDHFSDFVSRQKRIVVGEFIALEMSCDTSLEGA